MFQDDTRPSDHAMLIFAVLNRAVMDVLSDVAATCDNDRERARYEAIHFLTDEHGDWARSRRNLCDLVGLDHSAMREKIVAILDGDDDALPEYRTSMKQVEKTRELWAVMKAPKPERPRSTRDSIDDLLKLTASPETPTPPVPPSPGRARILARRAKRIARICELVDEGLTVTQMAEREGVHNSTISERVVEALEAGYIRRAGIGNYVTVPQSAVAACA